MIQQKSDNQKIAFEYEGMIAIKFPYNPDLVSWVKDSFVDRKWDSIRKQWATPLDITSIEKLIKGDFIICSKLREKLIASQNQSLPEIEITGLKRELYPFQKQGVSFIESKKGRVLIGDEMGCISGEAEIIINRNRGAKRYKLKDAYKLFNNNNKKYSNLDQPYYTRSLSLDRKEFRLNKILNVLYQGQKEVYELITETHIIKATADHIFFSENKEKKLEELSVNEKIYVNGIEVCPICGTNKNIIIYKYAKFKGYCKQCVYKHKRNNFTRYYSSKKKDTKNNNYIMIRGNLTYHPHQRTDGIPKHRLIYEAYLNGVPYKEWIENIKFNRFKIDSIFLSPDVAIHHINEIKTDNRLENLEMLTHKEHQRKHNNYKNFKKFFLPKLEKILSIKFIGTEDVYDIKMEHPNHNFIANGIVVHNCGKTIQTLAWLQLHPELRPALVICPASLKLNWQREIENTITDSCKTIVLSGRNGSKNNFPQADIYILNYDIIDAWKEELKGIKVVVLDECHYIKNRHAQRTKAIQELTKIIPHIIVMALTGTPIINRPVEFFNVLHILSPSQFPSFWKFAHRYCNAKHNRFGWDFNGASNTEELHNRLVKSMMLRRLKKDVLKDLPAKTRSVVPLEIENRKEYQKAEQDFILWLRGIDREKAMKAEGAETLVKIEGLKQLCIKGKLESAIEWIENFLEQEDKLVIFATHSETLNILQEKFRDISVRLDGSTSMEVRQKAVDEFQNNSNVKLFLGNIKAAGVGITLTASNTVVFLELGWTPGEHDQAEDRIHRIGQVEACQIYYLLSEGTIEEEIAALIDKKRRVLSQVLDGKFEVEQENLLSELLTKMNKEEK